MSELEEAGRAWVKTWNYSNGVPQLFPREHLDSVVLTRLRDVLRQTEQLWMSQNQWFTSAEPEIAYSAPSPALDRHVYDAQFSDMPPLEDWAIQLGNIHGALSAMRNNLFRDVLTRSTGWGKSKLNRKVPNINLDWPKCNTKQEWETLRTAFYFIPTVVLDRIEVTQPFRDLMPPGATPTDHWMRMGGMQSSRRFDSANKHERPAEVGVNWLLSGPHKLPPGVHATDVRQRLDTTDLTDPEPVLSFATTQPIVNPMQIQSLDVLTMVRYSAPDRPNMSPWGASRRDLWTQILEHLFAVWTLQFGKESARTRSDHLTPPNEWWIKTPDARFIATGSGEWKVGVGLNLASYALHNTPELHA